MAQVLTLLATAASTYLATRAELERPQVPQRVTAGAPTPPLGKPDTRPTTDEGVIAARTLEARLNPLLAELERRVKVAETRACLLEQELRDSEARDLEREAKRGGDARKAFERDTRDWYSCPSQLEQVRQRSSLREVSDSVLRPAGR